MTTISRRTRQLFTAVSCLLLAPAALAQTGVLFVEGDNVGIGISTPQWPLHVVAADPLITTTVWIQNSGPARVTFQNTVAGGLWSFGQENNGRFVVNRAGTGKQEFAVAPNGDVLVGASVVHSSSRAMKEDLQRLDPEAILAKLSEIPISSWSYKEDASAVRHIGPMAEDFYAAFGLGTDQEHIAINDSAGVALIAIQGLYRLVGQKDQEIRRLDELVAQRNRQLDELSQRLDRIEKEQSTVADGK